MDAHATRSSAKSAGRPCVSAVAIGVAIASISMFGALSRAGAEGDARRPRVYLSCTQDCFEAYLRQELEAFDIVREPQLADLAAVIVRQPAGNGGDGFTVSVARPGGEVVGVPRNFAAAPGMSILDAREVLRDLVVRALHVALVGTPFEDVFAVNVAARPSEDLDARHDRFHHWVFAPGIRGEAERIGTYYWVELSGSLTIRRITNRSKVRATGSYQRTLTGYELEDGSRPRGDVHRWAGRVLYAHSLGEHLSLGGTVATLGSQYENIGGHLHAGAVIELNAFPYAQNARRQLRFAYQMGSWSNWYVETTVNGRMRESHGYHAFTLVVDVNEPWGSIQWIGQANQFLDAPRLFRLSTGANLSVRVASGLAISLTGRFDWVHDQIALRGRTITDAEILVWTAQQRIELNATVELGVSYTFGSVFNTIVNPRFGRIDLEDE